MKYPLSIYILWHSDNIQGLALANTIFSAFSRDVQRPLQRGIGIPTYFISDPKELIDTINWEEASQTCVLFLIDEHMVIDEGETSWEPEILKVYNYCTENRKHTLFFPIATHKYANKFSNKLNISNRLNLYEEDNKEDELLLQIAFKLSTKLYPLKQNERELPVTVFISHARYDGGSLAYMVKDAIDQLKFGLTSFIDVKDIGKGENFENEISSAITESIFLVLNTDDYSSREWCIKEILYAKKNNCPIIHVNAAKNGTKRIFPYLGNIPSIKLKITETGNNNIQQIIAAVLLETLRYKYHKKLNEEILAKINKNEGLSCESLALPPELLTLSKVKNKQLLLYPDPPLGNEELSILKEEKPNMEFITPMIYTTQSSLKNEFGQNFLRNKIIGISISENTNLIANSNRYRSLDHVHLQDALVEISRYLLVAGAHCAYGGDINYSRKLNFTEILTDLIASYTENYNEEVAPIINHVFYPISETIKKDYALRSKYKGLIHFKFYANPLDRDFASLYSAKTAISLTYMRKKMFEQNQAQIFIAGKVKGYKGLIPGVLEEAYWAIKYQRPIYIVGAFGGISLELSKLLMNKDSLAIQNDSLENLQNEDWKSKYDEYTSYAQELWNEPKGSIKKRIHYEFLKQFFANNWIKNHDNLNNGLTQEENLLLFKSTNMLEVTRLIMKGLNIFFNEPPK